MLTPYGKCLVNWAVITAMLQSDWRSQKAPATLEIFQDHLPFYGMLAASQKAHAAPRKAEGAPEPGPEVRPPSVFLIAINILPGLAPRKGRGERDDPALSARRRFAEPAYDTPGRRHLRAPRRGLVFRSR
jgi:hypothetical protein